MGIRRGSYFIWERSALVLPFMPLRVLTTDSSYSILVLNHDWQPDKRYNLWDSWVGKIKEIRGNSPRNVRSPRFSTRYALTDLQRKIWLDVQWYFSGKDIAERQEGEGRRNST